MNLLLPLLFVQGKGKKTAPCFSYHTSCSAGARDCRMLSSLETAACCCVQVPLLLPSLFFRAAIVFTPQVTTARNPPESAPFPLCERANRACQGPGFGTHTLSRAYYHTRLPYQNGGSTTRVAPNLSPTTLSLANETIAERLAACFAFGRLLLLLHHPPPHPTRFPCPPWGIGTERFRRPHVRPCSLKSRRGRERCECL